MYSKKLATEHQPFVVHRCNFNVDVDETLKYWDSTKLKIVSIDPAINNFALGIFTRNLENNTRQTLFMDKVKFIDSPEEGIISFLDNLYKKYKDCNYIIIERQMHDNAIAFSVMHKVITYFQVKLQGKDVLIYELDPKTKGRYLGAPPFTYHELKKWSVRTAAMIHQLYSDEEGPKVLEKSKKKDDLADIVCQEHALFLYLTETEYEYKEYVKGKKGAFL